MSMETNLGHCAGQLVSHVTYIANPLLAGEVVWWRITHQNTVSLHRQPKISAHTWLSQLSKLLSNNFLILHYYLNYQCFTLVIFSIYQVHYVKAYCKLVMVSYYNQYPLLFVQIDSNHKDCHNANIYEKYEKSKKNHQHSM